MSDLYERDFYGWANEQAALLRAGNLSAADIEHIAEEIESMGRREKHELTSRLGVLLLHLLTWQFQSDRRGKSWRLSIENNRDALHQHMADNPGLKDKMPEAMTAAYRWARRNAAGETDLPATTFPAECPWSFDLALDDRFWPDATP